MSFGKKVCKERQQAHVRNTQLLADLTFRIVETAAKHRARRIGEVVLIEREDIMIRRQIRDRTNVRCAKKDFKGRAHISHPISKLLVGPPNPRRRRARIERRGPFLWGRASAPYQALALSRPECLCADRFCRARSRNSATAS